MRSGEASVADALPRPGRFKKVRDNLEDKEVVVGEGERRKRYVVIRNPAQVVRDREDRQRKLERLARELADLPSTGKGHTKAVCKLVAHPTLGRYLKKDSRGRLAANQQKVKQEERLDGKYLVLTSDDSLPPEEVALGYKQLAEVERAWRSLKTDLDLRPMYHRKSDRIRAHVLLCWLALLLVRVVETRCDATWPQVHREMDRMHRGVFECPSGRFVERTEPTQLQLQYLKAVSVASPPRFESIVIAPEEDTSTAA